MNKIELNKEQLAIIDEYCCDGMKKLKKLCDPIIMKIGGISEKDHDDIYSLAQLLLYKSVKNYDKDNANGASFKTFFYNILSRRIYATYIRDKNRQCRSNTRIGRNGEVIFIPDVSLDAPTEETQDIKEKIASDYNVEDESEFDFDADDNVELFMSLLSNNQRAMLEMKMQDIRCYKDDESMRQLMTKDPEYGKMEEDAYNMAAAYTGTENLLAVKDDYIEGGRVNMCKAIDDLILKGKLEGRVEGVRKEL